MQNLFTIASPQTPPPASAQSETSNLLFSPYWQQGSIALLASGLPYHRGLLAAQIAKALAGGNPIPGIQMTSCRRSILYIDTGPGNNPALFPEPVESLIHAAFVSRSIALPKWSDEFETRLLFSIEEFITSHSIYAMVFDSLDWLFSVGCTLRQVNSFLSGLRGLVLQYGVGTLVLGSLPRENGDVTALQFSNRQFSVFFSYFDSVFSLHRSSRGSAMFYLRHDSAISRGSSTSPSILPAFLPLPNFEQQFRFMDPAPEFIHSIHRPRSISLSRREIAVQMRVAGHSLSEIANYIGVTRGAVQKMLSDSIHLSSGVSLGIQKVYSKNPHN